VTTPSQAPASSLTSGQFRAATLAMMMVILLAALDQTIVSVAVPSIARQLGGFEWMAWVVSGYLIASTVVTPLYGRFSDLVGRRRVMSVAIIVFLIASIGCALARSLPQLVVARIVQGAGGGGLIATAQSVIADIVPLRERGRYQSYVSIVWAVASMLGPIVGGVLTQYLSWPWIFWINLPVGLLALLLVRRSLHATDIRDRTGGVDVAGALILLAGLTALLLPITRIGQGVSWSDRGNAVGAFAAVALLTAFALRQRRHPHPIVPMALLANPCVTAASALLFICFFNFIALSVLVPLRLQLIAGYSATDAGLGLLPLTLAIPVAAFGSGRWLSRTGRVLPLQRLGVGMVPVAMLTLSACDSASALALLALVVLGIGMGLQMPTTLISVQQSVHPRDIGTVTALTTFFRQLGGAIGIAVLSSVVLLQLHAPLLGGGGAHLQGLATLIGTPRTEVALGGGDDGAFRLALRLGAGLAALGWWFVARMPDWRLNEPPASAHGAAKAVRP